MKKIIFAVILIILAGFLAFLIPALLKRVGTEEKEIALKDFYKLTREDPLFYSSFFDAAEVEQSLKKFKVLEEQVKKITILQIQTGGYVEDFTAYIPITQEMNLVPYEFLDYLILINKMTEKFFQNPSSKLAKELLALYESAADSYIKDASRHLETLETLENLAERPLFLFQIDSITSSQVIKSDLLTIKENGYALKEEVRKRKNCLYGKESCAQLKKNRDNTRFLELLEESQTFNLEGEKIEFIKNQAPDIIKTRGPYRVDSDCWTRVGEEVWLYYQFWEKNGQTIFSPPKLATQNYYLRGPQELQEAGYEFEIQDEGTLYQCKDLTYYPQILALDFIQEQIKKGLLVPKDLEINPDYKLFIENQFGLLDQIIKHATLELWAKTITQLQDFWLATPAQLFLSNFHYSIFYFPFAESIWRTDKKLNYFVPEAQSQFPKPPKESIYVCKTLDELINLGYTLEEIQHFHLRFWEADPLRENPLWENFLRFY